MGCFSYTPSLFQFPTYKNPSLTQRVAAIKTEQKFLFKAGPSHALALPFSLFLFLLLPDQSLPWAVEVWSLSPRVIRGGRQRQEDFYLYSAEPLSGMTEKASRNLSPASFKGFSNFDILVQCHYREALQF